MPDLEIRAYLSQYLAGTLDLDEFEEWFIPATWDVERSGSMSAIRLAAEVRSALFDVTNDEATEDEFRDLARRLVREVIADLAPEPPAASDAEKLQEVHAEPVLTGS